MFKVEVKGLEEMQRTLRDLQRSIDPNTFNEWADHVGRAAKQICNDPDCKRIKLTKTGLGQVEYEFADREAIDCVIQAINRHLNSMPIVQQEIFKRLITEFETKNGQI
jgi:hypothetical protein